MKKFLIIFFCFYCGIASAQNRNTSEKPKLIIGLVVDQMRWDYLYRYQNLYGNDGFKRMLRDGFSCENTMIPYIPTYTAPGHTAVYTGSVPAIHGIAGNDWYDKSIKSNMYCTQDTSVNTLGSDSKLGKMSPKNLLVTTITDELRMSTNFQSKVFGVALKDRGAILPAGHSANAAYWYDDTNGKWISSTYYQKQLPQWLVNYNNKNETDRWMTQDWNTLLPIDKYTQSTADDKVYEGKLPGETSPVFPHKTSQLQKGKYSVFKYTPFASTHTFNMAKEIINNEKMGAGSVTDMITISISSTDYMGHTFGPNSIEAQDTYLRLDKDIADFLSYLDNKLGKDSYVLFLTADHAAAHVPGFGAEHGLPGGNFSSSTLSKELGAQLKKEFGTDSMIIKFQNNQIYVDYDLLLATNRNIDLVENFIIRYLNGVPFINTAFKLADASSASLPRPIKEMAINGYNQKRSGQIGFIPQSGYMGTSSTGTTHGLWNPYDAHIPLVWFGKNIQPGKTNREVYMTDIAPTIAAMLQIQMPSGNVGKVITEIAH